MDGVLLGLTLVQNGKLSLRELLSEMHSSMTSVPECSAADTARGCKQKPKLNAARACAYCLIIEPHFGKFKECSRCRVSVYCTGECQTAHWRMHKRNCVAPELLLTCGGTSADIGCGPSA